MERLRNYAPMSEITSFHTLVHSLSFHHSFIYVHVKNHLVEPAVTGWTLCEEEPTTCHNSPGVLVAQLSEYLTCVMEVIGLISTLRTLKSFKLFLHPWARNHLYVLNLPSCMLNLCVICICVLQPKVSGLSDIIVSTCCQSCLVLSALTYFKLLSTY